MFLEHERKQINRFEIAEIERGNRFILYFTTGSWSILEIVRGTTVSPNTLLEKEK